MPRTYWEELIEEMRQLRLPYSDTVVFELDGRPVGFISTMNGFVLGLYVHPEHQGVGIGRQLLNHVKATTQALELHVFAKNERGVSFYRREGFVAGEPLIDPSGEQLTTMRWYAK